ncbi:AAA family ATPase [Mucilaginibacter sp. X5P1]|uniref:AAA family ATPase n=1 Tax=Mucilaginibacter sp. X5P1 TaxID=2723088 RepID=UPI00160EE4C9|nr:AAA family ATPase [Mucilaginibacter sp. X5P1]MBB6139969.1 putative ATP-dependent endonuclease of OLD family [Mucilaginibacter sp. X5P1]
MDSLQNTLKDSKKEIITANANSSLVNMIKYHFKGDKPLQDLKKVFGYESDIFKILNILYVTKNLANIIITVKKEGIKQPISFNSLSEGEQQFIAIKGMIYLLQGKETLFLWDEPDTFLNPSWQWNLLPDLQKDKSLIQRDQFIMTSHSPIILSTVEKHAYFMEEGKINSIPKVYGRTVNDALSEQGLNIQGEDNLTEIDKLFELIEEREFTMAKETLNILEDKYGKNHPDLIRAGVLFNLYSK